MQRLRQAPGRKLSLGNQWDGFTYRQRILSHLDISGLILVSLKPGETFYTKVSLGKTFYSKVSAKARAKLDVLSQHCWAAQKTQFNSQHFPATSPQA